MSIKVFVKPKLIIYNFALKYRREGLFSVVPSKQGRSTSRGGVGRGGEATVGEGRGREWSGREGRELLPKIWTFK